MSDGTARRYSRGALALAWLALVGIEILTQLSLKAAGRKTGRFDFSLHAFQAALGCGWLWVGIASYCAGFFTWMFILARLDLSRAYPTSAIVFVAVMLASWLVLNEPIGTGQWIGASVIVAGILQLGQTERTANPPPIITE
jgi:drug/metabolite transporter (DMT)-like permease